MAETINDGGAAFPIPLDDRPGAYSAEPGMSLRDYFAAKAMQGQLAASGKFPKVDGDLLVRNAYALADAMLKARHD